ncbi:MAG: hypothetical protein AAGI07_19325, partial [Bacteroidota bacterium]
NKPSKIFNAGFIGNMMYEKMKPTSNGKINNKMKTFKAVNPSEKYTASGLDTALVLKNFKQQQGKCLELLNEAQNINLNTVKITSLIGPILRFKAGDAFRFLIAHEQRHMLQAQRVLKEVWTKEKPHKGASV